MKSPTQKADDISISIYKTGSEVEGHAHRYSQWIESLLKWARSVVHRRCEKLFLDINEHAPAGGNLVFCTNLEDGREAAVNA